MELQNQFEYCIKYNIPFIINVYYKNVLYRKCQFWNLSLPDCRLWYFGKSEHSLWHCWELWRRHMRDYQRCFLRGGNLRNRSLNLHFVFERLVFFPLLKALHDQHSCINLICVAKPHWDTAVNISSCHLSLYVCLCLFVYWNHFEQVLQRFTET